MIGGMVPMAIGFGEGGSQSAPLGRAVIGGLLGLASFWLRRSFEEQPDPTHCFRVIARLHQADARRAAPADLVLQAGPRAAGIDAV